jgi:ribosomal protein S18 acetylase RimI-like enzyme
MREDGWLGERLGRPAFMLDDGDGPHVADAPGFYQAKVDCADVERVHALEHAEFRVVDVNVTLRRDPGPLSAPAGVAVSVPRRDERAAVLEIAERDFTFSRFHLDPEIPDATAAGIKRDWSAALFDGERGERLLVARSGGAVIGFLGLLAGPVIELVAVRAAARRMGAGRALVAACADDDLTVGTQVANTEALRFYERLGFTAAGSRYVLHRHIL